MGDKVVQYVQDGAVIADVLRYCHVQLARRKAYTAFDFNMARSAAQFWQAYTPPIPEPKLVLEKSEEGFCFRRLPFDIEPGPTPLFDEFISRCSNADALKMFIGSLFYENADRQAYLWIYGQGMNGKGALLRLLRRIFGPAYVSLETPGRDDKFWNMQLLGKRVAAFPDCGDPAFPASQKFKMLTGGDAVPIEPKGQQAFTADINCKFIFASNDLPHISGQKSDRRRVIFCEVSEFEGDVDFDYDDKLWAEARHILFACKWLYSDRLMTTNGQIVPKMDQIDLVTSCNDEEFEVIFAEHFVKDNRKLQASDMAYFTPKLLVDLFKDLYQNQAETKRRRFIKWLKYAHNIGTVSIRLDSCDNTPRRVYSGAWCRYNNNALEGRRGLVVVS